MKRKVPLISAIAYVLSWIVGLSTGVPTLALNARATNIISAYTKHKTAGILQFVIAEGLTGLFLIIFVISVYRLLKPKGFRGQAFTVCGIIAGAISIEMAALGVILITTTIPNDTLSTILRLNDTINRLDGPKMWTLAVMGFSGALLPLKVPSWIKITGYAMGLALLLSGFSYGLLLQNLSWSAYISGLLPLVWVGSLGVYISSAKKTSKYSFPIILF